VDGAEVAEVLRARGRRVTAARLAVWRALADGGDHPTAEALAERVAALDPSVNLASVYRSLTLFEELGLARQSRLGEAAGRWEPAHPDEHFHVVCRICGSVDHHVGSLVQSVREHLGGASHGFAVEQVELTVTGRCAACAGA
jgi:Fur family transcriptional regulator, ferric uptake regulator